LKVESRKLKVESRKLKGEKEEKEEKEKKGEKGEKRSGQTPGNTAPRGSKRKRVPGRGPS
jgi:hypothetical protein